MSSILNKLSTEYFSEYFMKPYSNVKIYHGGKDFDLSKRWYIYYNYAHPTLKNKDGSPKMVQQNPIYYNINKLFHTKVERMNALKLLKADVEELLKEGWTPYDNYVNEKYTAEYSLDLALAIKKKEVKQTTYQDYEHRIRMFKEFLKAERYIDSIDKIDKKLVLKFLKTFSGAKNRNNTKAALSSIFTVLSNEDLIPSNFIKEISNKKAITPPIKIYTEKEVNVLSKILKENDYTLYMYVNLICFMFWRPIELVRLKVTDIDFDKRLMSVETKGKPLKTKIIPDIIFNELFEFCKDKTDYIFSIKDDWQLSEVDKRKYFTLRFSRFRKINNLDSDYKMYSHRHTYITKVYLELRKELSKEDTITKLSLITGHTSSAIWNYIQVNDLELPDDYSEYLK